MKYIRLVFIVFIFCIYPVAAQNPEELRSFLPEEIEGWVLSDKMEIFHEDNLFDRINGAAPLFIENNFLEMTAMEYNRGEDYITIQVYRHATPEDAFGMYASERSSDLPYLSIGGEAQGDDSHLYYFAGETYVKIWSNTNASPVLQEIASRLAVHTNPHATYPALTRIFPKKNLLPYSLEYITANYLGHSFLHAAYTAKYDLEGELVHIFILDANTPQEARKMLDSYFEFAGQAHEYEQGPLLVKDKYTGTIPLIWKGQYITGAFTDDSGAYERKAGEMEEILREIEQNIENIK
ncbi:MAG: hypothetical protein LUG18_06595 [Candidatus Azobacteroides sp.]|nr:hypothetical protein [Candidatus Azobacteroides sp.]